LRRFEITVKFTWEHGVDLIREGVRTVYDILSTIPKIDYIHLTYEYGVGSEAHYEAYPPDWPPRTAGDEDLAIFFMLQAYFGVLRGVGAVVIENVPHEFASHMKQVMTGSEPVAPLLKMYEVLEEYASDIAICEYELGEACLAMERGDAEQFKLYRRAIVRMLTKTREVYQYDTGGKASDEEVLDDEVASVDASGI
jgi:hypothetical protein